MDRGKTTECGELRQHRTSLEKTHIRGEKLTEEEFHIVVDILSVNKDGKILITKRHPDKPFGGRWEISGGSVISGETSLQGAVRELYEETGLTVRADELAYCGTIVRTPSGCLHDFYLYKGDFSEKDITLQECETVDFRLVTPDELYKMARDGEFLDFVYNRMKALYSTVMGEGLSGQITVKTDSKVNKNK